MYHAIFFDLFHTLVSVSHAPGTSGRYTADILGVDRQRWNEACFGAQHAICEPTEHLAVIRALAHSIDPTVSEALIHEACSERQRRFDHALENIEPSVLAALEALRVRGYKLGLISNASSGEVQAWSRSPLRAFFHSAVFSCEVGCKKPQAAIYQHALAELGCEAGQSLFVGDGGSDEHRGAAALGLDTVLITRHLGSMDPERLAQRRRHARFEIARLEQLLALLGSE